MKKILLILTSFFLLQACNNNGPAVQDDGIKAVDTNGGLADTAYGPNVRATDTSKLENREDISRRDTANNVQAR